jgi:hypothetical protein
MMDWRGMVVGKVRSLLKRAFRFYAPVMSVMLGAGFLALFATFSETNVQASVFTVSEDTGTAGQAGAGLGNTLLFIIPAILGSFGIVAIIKLGKRRLLKTLFRGALTFTTGIILSFFLYKISETFSERVWYAIYNPGGPDLVSVSISDMDMIMFFVCGLLFGYMATSMVFSYRFKRKERNAALIVVSALMGAFMAVILPTWTVVLLLIGLALWDIYAVFKGPIKDMVELGMDGSMMARFDPLGDDTDRFPFENMTYDAGSWQLGIGDLVFYSMLGAHSIYYSVAYVRTEGAWMLPFFFIPVLIAILIGFTYTIYKLSKQKEGGILPGLPVPMFLGVGTFSLMIFIATLI